MTDRLTIFLPVPPSSRDCFEPAARPGIRTKTPRNPQGWGSILIESKESEAYKATVASAWRQRFGLQHEPLAGDVRVTVIWCRERRSGDLPNRTKILYDALQNLAYENDKQIAAEHTARIDGHLPAGVLVIVEPLHADQAREVREMLDRELSAMNQREASSTRGAETGNGAWVSHHPYKQCALVGQHRADDCGIVTKAGRAT